MKLLLDENLSRRIVPFLQTDFPGSSQIALLGLESASDLEIWQYAQDHGFVIEVLNHTRPLTLSMIRRLHEGLGIPAECLIKPSQHQQHAV